MRATLRQEVTAFLAAHGPATAPEIALGVRARRADVDALLAGGGFCQVDRPEGAHPYSVYFAASRRVPRVTERSRAGVLLSILRDGAWHSRDEILRLAGRTFLTNNAAAELRRADFDVRYSSSRGYRLEASASSAVGRAT